MAQPAPRRRNQAQEEQQTRMQQADQILIRQLTGSGYSQAQAQEIVRLAHQLFTTGSQRPRPVVLQPTGIQSTISPGDLINARDFLMAVAAAPQVPVRDFPGGMTRNSDGRMVPIEYSVRSGTSTRRVTYSPQMFAGPPSTGPVVAQAPQPAPVRTFLYSVSVGGREYQVELRSELLGGRYSSLEQSKFGQLWGMLSASPSPVLGITSGGQPVNRDDFGNAYGRAYLAMSRQVGAGQQPDELIVISQIRRPRQG